MRKHTTFFLAVVICCFIACSKTTADGVSIRIENNTSQNFKEVLSNNKIFNKVKASDVTAYQVFDKVVALPWARLISANNDTAYAGALYNDPPVSYLSNGKYTLKIFEDTSTYYGYNCIYIKN